MLLFRILLQCRVLLVSASAFARTRLPTRASLFVACMSVGCASVSCADAVDVQIISVEYRGPNKGKDFTANAIMNCNGKNVCDFSCNNGTYADVDYGLRKICLIKYSCGNGPTLERTVLEKPDQYAGLLDCRAK
jgi:hypothetical protein